MGSVTGKCKAGKSLTYSPFQEAKITGCPRPILQVTILSSVDGAVGTLDFHLVQDCLRYCRVLHLLKATPWIPVQIHGHRSEISHGVEVGEGLSSESVPNLTTERLGMETGRVFLLGTGLW